MGRTKGTKNRLKSDFYQSTRSPQIVVDVAVKDKSTEKVTAEAPKPERIVQSIEADPKRKPCPKCGSIKIGQTYTDGHVDNDKFKHGRHYFLYCNPCGYQGKHSRIGYEEAERFWNER